LLRGFLQKPPWSGRGGTGAATAFEDEQGAVPVGENTDDIAEETFATFKHDPLV
jgi:hypothetical protein